MPLDELNPYVSPQEIDSARQPVALKQLRVPALGLLLLSVVWAAFGMLLVAVMTITLVLSAFVVFDARPSPFAVFQAAAMLPSYFIAYGAWCMRRGKHYRISLAAALMASIPILSPLIWVGMPFGIWAVVQLRRADVYAAFV